VAFFIKAPDDGAFVSLAQNATYWRRIALGHCHRVVGIQAEHGQNRRRHAGRSGSTDGKRLPARRATFAEREPSGARMKSPSGESKAGYICCCGRNEIVTRACARVSRIKPHQRIGR